MKIDLKETAAGKAGSKLREAHNKSWNRMQDRVLESLRNQIKAAYGADIDKTVRRNLDAAGAGKGKHGIFVLGNGGKAGRGQLDDPRAAHASGRNG